MSQRRILVVDDEPDICALVKDILEDEGFAVDVAQNAGEARSRLAAQRPDLVLLDIWMPGEDGISLLKSWQKKSAVTAPVIVISGHGTVATAVEATRLGACGFIEKPLTTAKLLQSVHAALAEHGAPGDAARAIREPVGLSPGARRLREEAVRLAGGDEHIAITGETGTGKTALAEYIHSLSARAQAPFVAVPGATLDDRTLDEALTTAAGGTLLIKRVHELPPQRRQSISKILTGKRLASARVRLITTGLHKSGGLFQKTDIAQTTLEVAALREHIEDIPELVAACADYWCQTRQLPYRRFSIAAQNRLLHYNWPGNLSELNELVCRLLENGGTGEISLQEAETQLQDREDSGAWLEQALNRPMREAREMFERFYLRHQLELVAGNISRLAAKIGMERTHLYRKLRSLGIHLRDGGKHP